MRLLHVIETLDANGEFTPDVGFADRNELDRWMEKFLPADILAETTKWRIVQYVPLITALPNGPLN